MTAILFILPMMTMLTAFLLIPRCGLFAGLQDWAVGGVRRISGWDSGYAGWPKNGGSGTRCA